MYFGIAFIAITAGVFLGSFCALLPIDLQIGIPDSFRVIMFIFGYIISITGLLMLFGRAKKTGADCLINPSRPGTVLWFFVYRDGEIRITPSIRTGEGQLYNPMLDSQIFDVKTYSIGDHKIRIVPEVVGHAVDLDYVMYVDLLKSKYGFENIKEVRDNIFDKLKQRLGFDVGRVISKESMIKGDEDFV